VSAQRVALRSAHSMTSSLWLWRLWWGIGEISHTNLTPRRLTAVEAGTGLQRTRNSQCLFLATCCMAKRWSQTLDGVLKASLFGALLSTNSVVREDSVAESWCNVGGDDDAFGIASVLSYRVRYSSGCHVAGSMIISTKSWMMITLEHFYRNRWLCGIVQPKPGELPRT